MRRIAVVATGAVAAAAAISLTVGTANAGTSGDAVIASGATTTIVSGNVTADVAKSWHSYNGYKTVYGHGTYSKGKKSVSVGGSVWDGRSKGSTYHAAVVLIFTQAGKSGYEIAAVVNPGHGSTATFPAKIKATYLTHFYVAEGLAQYKKGQGWVVVKQGTEHKIY